MIANYGLKTAPETLVVSVDDLKLNARIDFATDDALLAELLRAAEVWVEGYAGRALVTQTWQIELSAFVDRFELPYAAPLASVSSIKYYDPDGVLQTVSPSVYQVSTIAAPAYIELATGQSWPTTATRTNAVLIEYIVGQAVAAVPAWAVRAVKLIATAWYQSREMGEVPEGAIALCAPNRVWWTRPTEVCA